MSKFIGLVSAYAYAKSKGYTGTEEEFAILMAEYASVTATAVEAVRIATESAQSAAAASSDVNRAAATVTQQAAQVHDDAETSSENATTASEAKETAVDKALDSEAYALGTRDGEDVGSSDPAYNNNAKYYAEQGSASAQTASNAAQTATTKASEAQASASAAAESASGIEATKTGESVLPSSDIIQGSYDGVGGVTADSNRIRNAGFLRVLKGQVIRFVPGSIITQFEYGIFTTEKNIVGLSTWTTGETEIPVGYDGYIIVVFANTSKTDITPADYDATFSIIEKWVAADKEFSQNIIEFVKKYVKNVNISEVSGVKKLAGYSFGTDGDRVAGIALSSYDSYYFYTGDDAKIYFESSAPSTPTYIALTVGKSPSKTWRASGTGMLMDCSSASRTRKSENNLPTSSSVADISDSIVIITVNANKTTDFFLNNGLQLQDDVLLSQPQITQVINNIPDDKTPKVVYTSIQEFSNEKSTEQINIFLPATHGYIRYAYGHSVDPSINADSWRIFRAIATDDVLADRFPVTTYGEWEMAVKISGGSDFIGGILHGDEVMEEVLFFIDGKETEISSITELTDFSELRIVENTLLYNPDEPTENVAKHSKEYVFTIDGLTINQRVLWLMAKTLTTSYSCMFPLIRGNDTVSDLQVTAKYYDNNDYKTYDVSVGGVSGYPFAWHGGTTKANFWSEESGIYASAEIVKQPSLTGGDMSFVQNTVNQYNKLYFAICGIGNTYTTRVNEVWKFTSRYTINAVAIG